MPYLRQSTAQTIRFGPCLDKTDGVTEETALTLAQADMRLSKDGGAFAQKSAAGNATHDSDGWYSTALSTTDTDTVGELILNVHQPANMLPVWLRWWVLEEAVYDAIYGAAAAGPLQPTVAGRTLDVSAGGEAGIDWANVGTPGSTVGLSATTVGVTTVNTDMVSEPPTAVVIADAVWDEILTGSSHNIATSAGRRLRQIEEAFVHANGVIAVVTDGHTFTLDAGAVATADYYIGDRLQITEGTGAGQSRVIVGYTAGRVVTLDSDYITNPDTSSLYEVDAADVHVSISDADLAQGFVATYTNPTTITLDVGARATADYYVGELIVFTHGTGSGQAREITGYTAGRVVTMSPALTVVLDTTTVWHIQAVVSIPEIVDEVWDEARAGHVIAGSFGEGVIVETNSDKTGYAIGVGGIAATSFAAGAINAAATSTDFIDEIWAKICEDQGNYTALQILSTLLSACAGVTAAATFKTPNGVSSRITATLNASQERTAITLNPSAGA